PLCGSPPIAGVAWLILSALGREPQCGNSSGPVAHDVTAAPHGLDQVGSRRADLGDLFARFAHEHVDKSYARADCWANTCDPRIVTCDLVAKHPIRASSLLVKHRLVSARSAVRSRGCRAGRRGSR